MVFFVTGVAVLVVLVVLGRAFVAANPRSLVRALRYTVGVVLIAVGVVLALGERFGLALPLIAAGISALTVGRIGPIDLGGSRRSAGTGSTVRSSFLEMHLDHDTGAMTGTVVKGNAAGQALEDLDEAALLKLAGELAGDPESLSLLEAYLDRRMPGWRE
ncbi:MAG: molecular chaperone DnaJ, partial [Bauldia sp.]